MHEYEHLSVENCVSFLSEVPDISQIIDVARVRDVQEVGDGNLNLVYIIKDQEGRGVVLKQALPFVRLVGPSWPMTPQRAEREASATKLHSSLAPKATPKLYHFDPNRFIIVMEDLSDHLVWRTALNQGQATDGIASAMGDYVARVAFGTSIFSVDPEKQKELVAAARNPELCTITEDLVFTEPWVDAGRNSVLPENERDAQAIAEDRFMIAQMGLAKWKFMTQAEALIHGDLHTGSVMVKADDRGQLLSARAIDSEFAFYGPVAFDLGALWANYLIAASRAKALGENERSKWCLNLAVETWQAFDSTFRGLWPDRRDSRVFTEEFLEELMAKWQSETWLFACAKMTRRIVGLAKTSDIETLEPSIRVGAARAVLKCAQDLIRERQTTSEPSAFVAIASKNLEL
jgi:5-methylthioribose kinase